jgi:hypothetical protein
MRLILIITLLASMTANAAPVTWAVDTLLFSDGGSAYGSFTYDENTNLYSDIDITTLDSDGRGSANYQQLVEGAGSYDKFLYVVGPGAGGLRGLGLFFGSSLTNTGGTVAITSGSEDFCDDYDCWPPDQTIRAVVSGSVSAVPIPAAVWLFGSALAGLGWLRRKQSV